MSQKKTQPKKKKPLRLAKNWMAAVPGMAGRLLVLLIAVIVLGLMFSALQALNNAFLRIALSVLIAAGMALMHFSDGMGHGSKDASSSRQYARLSEKGIALTEKEDSACYHPCKAIVAAAAVYGIFVVMGIYIALMARDYSYVLQDLPTWLTDSYGTRADVLGALGAYTRDVSVAATDWIRLIARLPELMFINFFPDVQRMSGLIDRLTPLMLLLNPACFVVGYLLGPKDNAKREVQQKRAKKVAERKAVKSTLADELISGGASVHYGQKTKKAEHKRKELI